MFTKLNLTALLLVFLLAACAPAPQYGPVEETPPPAPAVESTPTTTPTLEATAVVNTDRPSRDARQEAESLYETVFTFRDFDQVAQDLCAVATEYGCWLFLALQDEYESVSTKWPGEKPSNIEATLLHAGTMSDGSEYQAWMVEADQVWTTNKVYWYPVFVWQDGAWLFFAPPTYRASMSLEVCGQILRYGEGSQHANTWDEDTWNEKYSACQTATPPPPTPFAPLTPVFTPQP
jgi:hypothetical protein